LNREPGECSLRLVQLAAEPRSVAHPTSVRGRRGAGWSMSRLEKTPTPVLAGSACLCRQLIRAAGQIPRNRRTNADPEVKRSRPVTLLLRSPPSLDCLDGGRNPMKLAVGTAVIWTIPSLTFHAALTGATNKLCARSRHRAHVGPIRPLGVIQAQRYWTFVSETEVLQAAFRTRRTPNSAITTSTPSVTTDIRISAHSRQCGRRDRRA